MTGDMRVEIAREYLAEAEKTDVLHMRPSELLIECAELRRQLAAVLAVIDGQEDPAGRLARIREVLAHFDFEFHDRQLALEEIQRIAGEPAGDPADDDIQPLHQWRPGPGDGQ